MKIIIKTLLLLLLTGNSLLVNCQSKEDPVKKSDKANKLKSESGILDKDVSEFLVKSADARMMDKKEGAMAARYGTTSAIRSYGKLMIKDQTLLLKKIKQLAAERKITLPLDISNSKEEGREDLAKKTGKDFDKKFVKMMKLDHERDIKMFTKAKGLPDSGVKNFAEKYLPLIQSHLDKLEPLKED